MKVSLEAMKKALESAQVAVEGDDDFGKCSKCGAACDACSDD